MILELSHPSLKELEEQMILEVAVEEEQESASQLYFEVVVDDFVYEEVARLKGEGRPS
jgi:hypothetical protein